MHYLHMPPNHLPYEPVISFLESEGNRHPIQEDLRVHYLLSIGPRLWATYESRNNNESNFGASKGATSLYGEETNQNNHHSASEGLARNWWRAAGCLEGS